MPPRIPQTLTLENNGNKQHPIAPQFCTLERISKARRKEDLDNHASQYNSKAKVSARLAGGNYYIA